MTTAELALASAALKDSINANCAENARVKEDGKRWHLGISIIGQECLRKTWYDYRWFSPVVSDGRMYRLFARGHDEETRIAGMLRRDGWDVAATDPATGKQWRYSGVHGHYGGSCDAKLTNMRVSGAWPNNRPILGEFKTHNTKSFCHVVANGLSAGKPQHYVQMSCYGKAFSLEYGLYFAVNKNDDDIYPAFTALDHDLAERMEMRAEYLILARVPPPRISNKSTDFRCGMCDHRAVCHSGAPAAQHCRSCQNSYPVDAGEWTCNIHNAIIPRDIAKVGCPQWAGLPEC